MKTADHITTSRNLQHEKAQSPFVKKDGEPLFFSEVQPDVQPFFGSRPAIKDNYFFSSAPVQAKLTIGHPGDKYEKEADAVAGEVVENLAKPESAVKEPQARHSQTAESGSPAPSGARPAVQPEVEESQEEEIAGKEEEVQRKAVFEDGSDTFDGQDHGKADVHTPAVQLEEVKEGPEEEEGDSEEKEIRRKPIFESDDDSGEENVQPKLAGDAPAVQRKVEEQNNLDEEPSPETPELSAEQPAPESEPAPATEEAAAMETPDKAAPSGEETAGNSEITPVAEKGETGAADMPEAKAEESAEAGPEAETSAPEAGKIPAGHEGEGTASETPAAGEKAGESSSAEGPEKTAGETGKAEAPKEGKPAKMAQMQSGGSKAGDAKMATSEKEKGAPGEKDEVAEKAEVPKEEEAYEFPKPEAELPGQMPPPLGLGIPESQQGQLIQAKGAPVEEPSEELTQKLQGSGGKGQSLDKGTAHQMGQQIGGDFRDVKIHTDSEAAKMNKELGAKAFTHGKDIYFGDGQFDSGSEEGQRLLAHELTHTVQQGAVPAPAIQRVSARGIASAVGKGAKALGKKALEKFTREVKKVGNKAVSDIKGQATALFDEAKQKANDWKDQLFSQAQEYLSGDKLKDMLIGQAKAKAEELLGIKLGKGGVPEGLPADALPEEINTLMEKVQNFASGEGMAESVFGGAPEQEQQALQEQMQQDAGDWEEISAVTGELAPYAAEKQEDVRNLVSAFGKLKKGNWKSMEAWKGVFEAGKGFVPGLDGAIESGKKALAEGIGKLKENLTGKVNNLWESGSKLANQVIQGAEQYKQRAVETVERFKQQMFDGANKAIDKVMNSVQSLRSQGNEIAGGLIDKVSGMGSKVANFAGGAVNTGSKLLSMVPGSFAQKARSTLNQVKGTIKRGESQFKKYVGKAHSLRKKINSGISRKLNKVTSFAKNAVKKVENKATALLNKAKAKMEKVWQSAMKKGRDIKNKIVGKAKDALNRGKEWLNKKVVNPVKDRFKKTKERISKFVKEKKEAWKKKQQEKNKPGEEKDKDKEPENKDKEVKEGLAAIDQEESKYLKDGKITKENAEKVAQNVKGRHKVFKKLTVIDGKDRWNYDYIQRVLKQGERKVEIAGEEFSGNEILAMIREIAGEIIADPKVVEAKRKIAGQGAEKHLASRTDVVGAAMHQREGTDVRNVPADAEGVKKYRDTIRLGEMDPVVKQIQKVVGSSPPTSKVAFGPPGSTYPKIEERLGSKSKKYGASGKEEKPLNDKQIAEAIQAAASGGPLPHGIDSNSPIGKDILRTAWTVFGVESSRNPANLVTAKMTLDLVASGEITLQDAFNKSDSPLGGGELPMSMQEAVEAVRFLDKHVELETEGKVPSYKKTAESKTSRGYGSESESAAAEELAKREIDIVEKWAQKKFDENWVANNFKEDVPKEQRKPMIKAKIKEEMVDYYTKSS